MNDSDTGLQSAPSQIEADLHSVSLPNKIPAELVDEFLGKIPDADGQAVETGCVGFGLERLALAFLAQHGLKETAWPAAVADCVSRS